MKILSSIIRRRLYNFLIKNSYIESDIQKGFWDNVPGTIEHNEQLTHMINHARKRQRGLFITLIDLRDAFGEVHHSLLNKVLEYHHVPNEVKSLIQNMYKDFQISVGTKRNQGRKGEYYKEIVSHHYCSICASTHSYK